jgi:hypothetical protein
MELKKRINAEKRIARLTVDSLLRAGFELAINNGGDEMEVERTSDERKLYKGLQATDEDVLITYRDGKRAGYAQFVYGNDGFDVLADYTINLEEWIGAGTEVDQLCRKIEAQDAGIKYIPRPACQVFAMCTHEATTKMPHPVLGEVPACLRCANKMKRLEAK